MALHHLASGSDRHRESTPERLSSHQRSCQESWKGRSFARFLSSKGRKP